MTEPSVPLSPIPQSVSRDALLLPREQHFLHRGIVIKGVDYLEQKGILTHKDVTDLLDRLPEGYFRTVPLREIDFEPYKMYSIERNGKIIYAKENDIQSTDTIIARKRGVNHWNSKMEGDIVVPTDGKITIRIFSPLDWENKNDKQLDKNIALYSLAHELGHTIWNAIVYLPGIFEELHRLGIPFPCSEEAAKLLPFIEQWKLLPESALQRYIDYKDVFTIEHKSETIHLKSHLKPTIDDLAKQEDFATSYEHFLYWQNLQILDERRFILQEKIYNALKK